jgi:hypothetical protein
MGELKAYRVGARSASDTRRFSAPTSSQVNIRTRAGRWRIAVLRRGTRALCAQPPGPHASGCRSTVVDAGGGCGGERG